MKFSEGKKREENIEEEEEEGMNRRGKRGTERVISASERINEARSFVQLVYGFTLFGDDK